MHVTAASFRLKYAIASFLVVLLAAATVAVLFMVRHPADGRSLSALWLALAVGASGALIAAALMWRAVSHLQRPLDSLIRSAERIGQGDYTRPVEVQRRDVLS